MADVCISVHKFLIYKIYSFHHVVNTTNCFCSPELLFFVLWFIFSSAFFCFFFFPIGLKKVMYQKNRGWKQKRQISLRYRFPLILKLTNESRAWDRRKRACRYQSLPYGVYVILLYCYRCKKNIIPPEPAVLASTIFRRFPTIFRRFPMMLKTLSGAHTNVSQHFPNFSEDSRRLPRTVRRCFGLISIYFGSFIIETWQIIVSKRDEIDIFARETTGDPCNLIDSQQCDLFTNRSNFLFEHELRYKTWTSDCGSDYVSDYVCNTVCGIKYGYDIKMRTDCELTRTEYKRITKAVKVARPSIFIRLPSIFDPSIPKQLDSNSISIITHGLHID